MNSELLKLVQENPDLPIFAWVNAEICGDGFGYWLGQFNRAMIREYVDLGYSYGYMEQTWVFKDDPEDFIDWDITTNEAYKDMSVEEAEKKSQEYLDSLEYKKGIFVFVDSL